MAYANYVIIVTLGLLRNIIIFATRSVAYSFCVVINITSPEVPSVRKLGSGACENSSAGSYHVCGEGELLTEKDEDSSVLLEGGLCGSAFPLEPLNLVGLIVDDLCVPVDGVVVMVDAVCIVIDAVYIIVDAVLDPVNVLVKHYK